jgi:hypothetical protein
VKLKLLSCAKRTFSVVGLSRLVKSVWYKTLSRSQLKLHSFSVNDLTATVAELAKLLGQRMIAWQ